MFDLIDQGLQLAFYTFNHERILPDLNEVVKKCKNNTLIAWHGNSRNN